MPHLILIKHSLPQIDESVPAKTWRLSEEGRLRCQALAQQLTPYAPDRFIASTESKATETAQIVAHLLNKPFTTAENLHEHERTTTGYLGRDAFEQAVQHFFENPDQLVFGEETADAAYNRFSEAIHTQIAGHLGQNLAIIAHGTVISLFVARVSGVEPFPLWKRLGLPSFVVLDGQSFGLIDSIPQVVFKSPG